MHVQNFKTLTQLQLHEKDIERTQNFMVRTDSRITDTSHTDTPTDNAASFCRELQYPRFETVGYKNLLPLSIFLHSFRFHFHFFSKDFRRFGFCFHEIQKQKLQYSVSKLGSLILLVFDMEVPLGKIFSHAKFFCSRTHILGFTKFGVFWGFWAYLQYRYILGSIRAIAIKFVSIIK